MLFLDIKSPRKKGGSNLIKVFQNNETRQVQKKESRFLTNPLFFFSCSPRSS